MDLFGVRRHSPRKEAHLLAEGVQDLLNQIILIASLNSGDPSLINQKSLSAYIMTAHSCTFIIVRSALFAYRR